MTIAIVIDLIDTLTNGSVMTARRFADGLRARGHEALIRAVARSAHRDDIHLTLLGNGPMKEKLFALAEREGVDVSFDFLPKERLIRKLQESDLYVHTATVEIEAIACGLVPVIAESKLSATKQFALDERSLFPDGDVDALAKRIDYWYEHPAERAAMGG